MTTSKKITKDTTIQEALAVGDGAFDVLTGYFGPSCLGCGAAAFETIAMGCQSHGIDDSLIPKIVSELQTVADRNQPSKDEKASN